MAIWQFKAELIPEYFLGGRDVIPEGEWDVSEWWMSQPPSDQFVSEISNLLPPLKSWSDDLEQWGKQDSDLIEIWREGGAIELVSIRLDAREVNFTFIEQLLELASNYKMRIVYARYRTVQPQNYNLFVASLTDSPSYKVCRNTDWLPIMAQEISDRKKR